MPSYHRRCKWCGRLIQLRQMPDGQWVAFEGYDTVHSCNAEPPSAERDGGWASLTKAIARQESKRTEELIAKAISERLVVAITYTSRYRGYPHRTSREIEPLDRVNRTVRAYCRLRHGERVFRLDRIEGAELTGETFTPRPKPSPPRPPRRRSVQNRGRQTTKKRHLGAILFAVALLALLWFLAVSA